MATGKITKAQREKKEHDDETATSIRATLNGYYPGKWAAEVNYGPACLCGKPLGKWASFGGGIPSGICYRHPWSHIFAKAGL